MVDLLYFLGAILAAIPFCPMITILAPFLLAASFKYEWFIARKFQSKPEKAWKSQVLP